MELREFEKDWRGRLIMAVAGGAVGWVVWQLTQVNNCRARARRKGKKGVQSRRRV